MSYGTLDKSDGKTGVTAAKAVLRGQGLRAPNDGRIARDPFALKAAGQKRSLWGPRIKKRDLLNVTSQLAIMTRSGVDLSSALQSLVRQCRCPPLRDILAQVSQSVMGGNSVSESLGRYDRVFDKTYVASIAAGEASGRLPEVLQQLASLQRAEIRLRSSVRTMLAYPVLLMGVSSVVLLALILFVLPRFEEIFSDFDAPLPALTRFLLVVSSELRSRYWLWLPLFATLIGGLIAFRSSATGRRLWDRFTLYALVVRDVSRALLIARCCRLLGLMIDSGVPLLECLRLVKSAVKNSLYRGLFDRLEDDVLNGRGLSAALSGSDFIPGAASEMLMTAERTGTLGAVTQMVGLHFEEEGEAKLKELVAVLEPAITVGMGLVVAMIVMSVMLPLFDLSSVAD